MPYPGGTQKSFRVRAVRTADRERMIAPERPPLARLGRRWRVESPRAASVAAHRPYERERLSRA